MFCKHTVFAFVLTMFIFAPLTAYAEPGRGLVPDKRTYVGKSELSGEEHLEYLSLVEDLRLKFQIVYRYVSRASGNPSIGRSAMG